MALAVDAVDTEYISFTLFLFLVPTTKVETENSVAAMSHTIHWQLLCQLKTTTGFGMHNWLFNLNLGNLKMG
jgi:hypothetical protein